MVNRRALAALFKARGWCLRPNERFPSRPLLTLTKTRSGDQGLLFTGDPLRPHRAEVDQPPRTRYWGVARWVTYSPNYPVAGRLLGCLVHFKISEKQHFHSQSSVRSPGHFSLFSLCESYRLQAVSDQYLDTDTHTTPAMTTT